MEKTIQISSERARAIAPGFGFARNTALADRCTAPVQSGTGLSMKEIGKLMSEYDGLKGAIVELIDTTEAFIKQAVNDAEMLDFTIAEKMKREG